MTTVIGASRVASERRSESEFVQSDECEVRRIGEARAVRDPDQARRIVIVLGLDAGLADFGWAVVSNGPAGPLLHGAGAWNTKPVKGAIKAADRLRRSRELASGVADLLWRYRPTHVALESANAGGNFGPNKRGGGTIAAVSSGYAAGLVAACIELAAKPTPVTVHYQPRDWRRIVLGEIGEEGEAAAHRTIRSVFDGAGAEILAALKKGQQVHATDAAGIALATYRKHRTR